MAKNEFEVYFSPYHGRKLIKENKVLEILADWQKQVPEELEVFIKEDLGLIIRPKKDDPSNHI